MALLQISNKYGNTYEQMYHLLKNKEGFDINHWQKEADAGKLDLYINAVKKSTPQTFKTIKENIPYYDYANQENKLAALYNEIYADKTNVNKERIRYKTNEVGAILKDDKGNPLTETYFASDYDYYNNIIKENAEIGYQKYLRQVEQDRKDAMSPWVKHLHTIVVSPLAELIAGAVNTVDNLISGLGSAVYASVGAIKGDGRWDDLFVESTGKDNYRILEGVEDWLIDFESRYTYMRDIDGNFTTYGKYIGGVSYSLGQMVPSLIVSAIPGVNALAQPMFYASMNFGTVRENYKAFQAQGISVPTWSIIVNAGVKAGLQMLVELGLGKIFKGPSNLDSMFYGKKIVANKIVNSGTTNLKKAALNRILKDAAQEGLEEVLQDTSDFFVDSVFNVIFKENYGSLDSMTFQNLADAFIIGAMASIAGNAVQIAGVEFRRLTNRGIVPGEKFFPKVATNKDGKVDYKKLDVLSAWEYGLNMKSFANNYNAIIKMAEKLDADNNIKANEKFKQAYTEMYGAYRILSSLYTDLGPERFNAANEILTAITNDINEGKYNNAKLYAAALSMMKDFKAWPIERSEKLAKQLAEAGMTKVEEAVENIEQAKEIENKNEQNAMVEILNDSMKETKNAKGTVPEPTKHIVTTNGEGLVEEPKSQTAFVYKRYLEVLGSQGFNQTKSEKFLVETIIKAQYKIVDVDNIVDLYKKCKNLDKVSREEAIYNLLFNEKFAKFVFRTANKSTFNFVNKIIEMAQKIIPDTALTQEYKLTVERVVKMYKIILFQYCITQPKAQPEFVTIFDDKQRDEIRRRRWNIDLGNRLLGNKLAEDDKNALKEKLDNMSIPLINKPRYYQILSDNVTEPVLREVYNALNEYYNNMYQTPYNGKKFPPDNSIPNRLMIAYLENIQLDLENMFAISKLTEDDIVYITNKYGDVTRETVFTFRKEQFETFTNKQYTFKYDNNGKIAVIELSTNIQTGYMNYLSIITETEKTNNFKLSNKELTFGKVTTDGQNIVTSLLNKNIPEATKYMITLNDIIFDPSLLSDDIYETLQASTSDDITSTEVYGYLREYIIEKYPGLSLTILEDGTIAFIDVRPMQDIAKTKTFSIDKNTKIQDIIKPQYLVGRLKDIKINFNQKLPEGAAGFYDAVTNSITFRQPIKKNDLYNQYAFIHEFHHAIQAETHVNGGFVANIFEAYNISKADKQHIINDIKNHVPEAFVEGVSEEEIASNFLYHSSNEMSAYGFVATPGYTLYPTVITKKNNKRIINTSWGSTYELGDKTTLGIIETVNSGMQVYDELTPKMNTFNQSLNFLTEDYSFDKFKEEGKDIIIDINGELRKAKDGNINEVIENITSNGTNKEGIEFNLFIPTIEFSTDDNTYGINIPLYSTGKTLNTLKQIINYFYEKNIKFVLYTLKDGPTGPISIGDVLSEEATTADEVITLFNYYRADNLGNNDRLNIIEPSLESYIKEEKTDKLIGPRKERTMSERTTVSKRLQEAARKKSVSRSENRHVRKDKNSNAWKYGYIGKYDYVAKGLTKLDIDFINKATPNIDEDLWEQIIDGKITKADIMIYFKTTNKMNQETFDLYNDVYFKNKYITSFTELEKATRLLSPQYYALQSTLRIDDQGISSTRQLEKVLATIPGSDSFDIMLKFVEANSNKLKNYENVMKRYSAVKITNTTSSKQGEENDIDNGKLRMSWMEYYNGDWLSGAHAAAIGKWLAYMDYEIGYSTDSKKGNVRLESKIGGKTEDIKFKDTLKSSAMTAEQYIISTMSKQDKVAQLRKHKLLILAKENLAKISDKQEAQKVTMRQLETYMDNVMVNMTPDELNKEFAKVVKQMSDEDIDAWTVKAINTNMTAEEVTNEEIDKFARDVAKRGPADSAKNIRSLWNNIYKNLTNNGKRKISKKNTEFLKNTFGNLITDNFRINSEEITVPSTKKKNKREYKSLEELNKYEEKLRVFNKKLKERSYTDKQLQKELEDSRKLIRLQNMALKNLEKELNSSKKFKTVTLNISSNDVVVSTAKPIPPILQTILDSEFTTIAKSKTQYYTNDTDAHIRANWKMFIENNVEILATMTQADVDDIIDFYDNSEIIPTTNNRVKYLAAQIWILTYIDSPEIAHNFILTDEQHEKIKNRIEPIMSIAGAAPNVWHQGLKQLRPQEVISAALAKSAGIQFSTESNEKLSKALLDITKAAKTISSLKNPSEQDIKNYNDAITNLEKVREEIYKKELENYQGNKLTFLDKLLKWEQMCMLSGPGTWVRNWTSNIFVTGSLKTVEGINTLIGRMFPKFKESREGQYKIIGTEPIAEVNEFIKTHIQDTNLLTFFANSANKWDTRKLEDKTDINNIVNLGSLIRDNIKVQIFRDSGSFARNVKKGKKPAEFLDKASDYIYKKMSDDKFVNKRFYYYISRTMTEDIQAGKLDLTEGFSNEVIEHIVNAYTLAAEDFMHKTNFWNGVEKDIKNKYGNKIYFAYKQVFPFMSASWNWFLEALKYNPIGLAYSIKKLKRLDDTINKLDEAKRKGEKVISSKFAEYLAKRDIGKGILGSVLFGIGLLAVAFNIIDLDDEDKKVKLKFGNTYIDISDIFGANGLFAGISTAAYYKEAFKDSNTPWYEALMDATASSLNTMFINDAINTVYSTLRGILTGDANRLIYLPDKILQMNIPNFWKTITGAISSRKPRYTSNIILKPLQKMAVSLVSSWPFPHYIDPYTGEEQLKYVGNDFVNILINIFNKLSPIDISPYKIGNAEKIALSLGVTKGELTGTYTINNEKVNLTAKEKTALNKYYGQLNAKDLKLLYSNKEEYKVYNENTKKYEELYFKQMNEKQKKTVIERIMSNNGDYSKIYILTNSNKYKYYANSSEYDKLLNLGITKNILEADKNNKGFVKIN